MATDFTAACVACSGHINVAVDYDQRVNKQRLSGGERAAGSYSLIKGLLIYQPSFVLVRRNAQQPIYLRHCIAAAARQTVPAERVQYRASKTAGHASLWQHTRPPETVHGASRDRDVLANLIGTE